MQKTILSISLIASSFCLAITQAPSLQVGDKAYINAAHVRPGQMRYSEKNIALKIEEARKGKGITENNEFQFDEGKSCFPISDAAPVIKIKDKDQSIAYILQDKHHHTLAVIALAQKNGINAKATVPVKVTKDLSHMPYTDFWKHAEKNFWVDLIGVDNKSYGDNPPASFAHMQNDPVRYFVSIAALKVNNGESLASSEGADFPLWVKRKANTKTPKELPGDEANERMIENMVSQLLINHGFSYDDLRDGESGPSFNAKVLEAHKILADPKNKAWIAEKGVRLVKQPGYINGIIDDINYLSTAPDPLAVKK